MLCRCRSFVCIVSGRCAWILLSYGLYCNCDKVFTLYPVGSEAIAWGGPESCFGRVLYLVFSKFCCRFIGNVVTGKLKMLSLFCNCEVYLCMLIKMYSYHWALKSHSSIRSSQAGVLEPFVSVLH